ncbi:MULTISPECIES: glycine betaine ABC transporter substrate-binding protein [unclassified Duganella]|uniref:glycine betaine ABC transporter substrate-binding protein n=1 Tax=unclassified Duganella TaxID=2636909 RepID=UPI000E3497FC|nr:MULTISPECIES: glycine betaine ABC transporter substrate-binding protein [unclassified Duganella]RFP09994.1 glycine/betaine ABC transporter substrate-binding protein [Duganella sp. BJB475]RFP25701.1 glycine/betaine ABC transporter substrate-binding protein [Duganella sp. BJB476]
MKPIIRLGHIGLSFHAAGAAVVQRILESHGYMVQSTAAAHEEMFRRYGAGEVDMLASAWLSASHGAYLAPYQAQTRKLGVLYRPYCIWGVPDYVPEELVASVDDLATPAVAARMSKLLQGINPGAGISRFSRQMMSAYGLEGLGYRFENGSEDACFRRYEDAVRQGLWLVVPLWHPQFLHHRQRIRALAEPLGLLGGRDEATLIVREECAARMAPAALAQLSELSLGNRAISELDHMICRQGLSPLSAADAWLAQQKNATGVGGGVAWNGVQDQAALADSARPQ